MSAAEQIATMLQEAQVVLQETKPLKGLPRYLGVSADQATAVELLGPLNGLRGLTIQAVFSPTQLEAAGRNGRLLEAVLRMVAPHWVHHGVWLAHLFQTYQRMRPQLLAKKTATPETRVRLPHGELVVRFHANINTVVMRVRLKGGFHATPTA